MTNQSGYSSEELLQGRYQLQQALGKNTGRRTFLAWDQQTQQHVVIKQLLFGPDFEWDDLKLFEREAAILQNLSHPAIPRYLDFFELFLPYGKGFALVQTYVAGESLEAQLQAGRTFAAAEVKQIAQALLEILIYLHGRQPPVIHRDIKPSNILLSDRSGHSVGQVHLVDFGAVKTLGHSEGGTLTIVGTYGYMPPEQFGGRTEPASDLYSLGATLIRVITGSQPADLPQQDLRINFESATTQLSPSFSQWLRQMTEPSLEKRFASAELALAALQQPAATAKLTVTRKPPGTHVQLHKTPESLKILIPPSGFDPSMIFVGLFAVAWNSFIFMWTGFALMAPLPINLVFALFSLPFWAVGFGMVMTILFPIFGRVHLHLTSEQIALTYEFLGIKYQHPRPTNRQDIFRLDYNQRMFRKDSDGDRIEVKPKLVIWAGHQKYELGGNGLLNEPELDWLAGELGYWLSLPVTRIQH